MSEETDNYIDQLEEESKALRNQNSQLQGIAKGNVYQNNNEESNIIQHQLDTAEMLSRIEHFLKGDYITIDAEGNEVYTVQSNEDLILFNEYGVNSIMLIISNYLDKMTILSFYDEMRINEILADLGDELANFIFCNYEKMGMTTEFKKSRYNLIVLNILHSIESAYRRALGGKEREEIHSTRILTQSDMLGNPRRSQLPRKKFNLFSPKSW